MQDPRALADMRQLIAQLAQEMPDRQSLDEALQSAHITNPQLDLAKPTSELWANVINAAVQGGMLAKLFEILADRGLPVPTTEELSETSVALREHVLPKTSQKELREAVDAIPADPEKVKLAAFLTGALKEAISTSPTPWAVFVVVFWVAMQINPVAVGALALAFAVMAVVNPPGK